MKTPTDPAYDNQQISGRRLGRDSARKEAGPKTKCRLAARCRPVKAFGLTTHDANKSRKILACAGARGL